MKNCLHNVFVAIASASAIALLAGCGGGDSSRDALMDLETEFAAEQERVAALEAELDAALDAAQTAATAAAARIAALEMAQSEAAQEFMAAQTEAGETIAAERLKVTNLQSELETAQGELEMLQTQHEMVVEEKEAAEKLASDRAIELANQERDLRIMIATLEGRVRELGTQLTGSQDALAKAETERDAAVAARIEAERLAATEQSTVQAQLVAARQDILRLQSELQAAQNRLARVDDEIDEITDERDDAVDRADRADARDALSGTYMTGGINADVRYRESATVWTTSDPGVTPIKTGLSATLPATFASKSTSTTGKWLKTTLSNRSSTTVDQAEIYSDVGAPDNIPFVDSELNDLGQILTIDDSIPGTATATLEGDTGDVVDSEGNVVRWLGPSTLNAYAATASSFPRTSTGGPTRFTLTDRGGYTQAQLNENKQIDIDASSPTYVNVYDSRGFPIDTSIYDGPKRARNPDTYPERYSYQTSGRLKNASGKFVCGSGSNNEECTVQNTGDGFHFIGPWRFQPSSSSQRVRVPDEHYMWFGWWRERTLASGDFEFRAGYGGSTENEDVDMSAVGDINGVTGVATYDGVASGQYAIYQTLGTLSSHGRFDAKAKLVADFGDATISGSVSGSITGFSQQPDWSLTLHSGSITATGGIADGSVSWLIGGIPQDAGDLATAHQWEAQFYSNIDLDAIDAAASRSRVRPYGIAGAFTAVYSEGDSTAMDADQDRVGRMIGAFGAHTQ